MRKSFAFVVIALTAFAATVGVANVRAELTVNYLLNRAEAFDGSFVRLQGYLALEQLGGKPENYYLRDDANNMVKMEFQESFNGYGFVGKRIEVAGYFSGAEGPSIEVTGIAPLDALEDEPRAEAGPFGILKTLVCLSYFTDRSIAGHKTTAEVYRMIFNDMNSYWMETSYDLISLDGDVDSWRQVDHNVKYYGYDNPSWYLIRDAVAKADAAIDFSQYTRYIFMYAGPGEETSGDVNDIWYVRWSGLNIATNDLGGTYKVTHGAIAPDIQKAPYGSLGHVTHEFGHELGLGDLYGYAGEVGAWDTMCTGNWNNLANTPAQLTSYSRLTRGWISSLRVRELPFTTAELLTLDPLEDATGGIQVIRLTGIEPDEYYLIEARRKVGFDEFLPGEKVLVLYQLQGKLYLKAALSAGETYRDSSAGVEVMVAENLDNWSFQVYVAYKVWGSDRRLTDNGARSDTNQFGRSVASVGSYVYVAWADTRNGNWEIYFKRSKNSGLTWSGDVRLTSDAASSVSASIAAYGCYVYVVWADNRDGNWEIYMRRSEDYGATWPSISLYYQRLTNDTATSYVPCVAAYGRNVHVVWTDDRKENWEIYYKRSTDNGLTWGSDTRLTSNTAISQAASVAAFGKNVYVAWEDDRAGNFDIFVKKSPDNGVTWTQKKLTSNLWDQRYPKIAAYGYDVHVVWADTSIEGNVEIFYRRSIDRGDSYKPETRLTVASGESTFPCVAVKGKTVYVVWQDKRTGEWEIWFKDSPDRGVHWTADRILSDQPDVSQWPSVSVSGDNVYVVWTDNRDGNYEIYYKNRW